MEDVLLKEINFDEFEKEIYRYYLDIFPEEERKPLKLIQSSYEKNCTKAIEILYKSEMVGFMLLNKVKDEGYLILDYFAVLPTYRNKGLGTEAMKLLIEQEKETKGIFIEIEKIGLGKDKQENLWRQKRKKFYENIGFKKLNFELSLFNVIYTPYIFSNRENDENHIIDEIFNIYKLIYGSKRIEENCKIIKKLRFEELTENNIKIMAKTQYEIFPTSSAYSVYKAKVSGERKTFYTSYIAYLENKPVGIIGLYDKPECPDTVWLSWFGLIKEYRKMGLGKQMLDFIIEVAKKDNRKFLRLYTFEVWNAEAQKFYQKNMDIEEYYFNEREEEEIFKGKPKIFGKSLCSEKMEFWNNKFINISESEASHEKSVFMMKQDGII